MTTASFFGYGIYRVEDKFYSINSPKDAEEFTGLFPEITKEFTLPNYIVADSMGGKSMFTEPEITYEQMVRNLFKQDPSRVVRAHHAATGLAGEAGEILNCVDRKNILEELGDLAFYREALIQQLDPMAEQINETHEVINSPYYHPRLTTVLINIQVICSDILDLTKKSWVYERELKQYEIWQALALLSRNLDYFVDVVLGATWSSIKESNMEKLLKGKNARYKSGTYSNEQALARADKLA